MRKQVDKFITTVILSIITCGMITGCGKLSKQQDTSTPTSEITVTSTPTLTVETTPIDTPTPEPTKKVYVYELGEGERPAVGYNIFVPGEVQLLGTLPGILEKVEDIENRRKTAGMSIDRLFFFGYNQFEKMVE